jgi:hypothetical protein
VARLVRHALNRGNVLEGPLTDRIADAGNPGCQGQVDTQLCRSSGRRRTAALGQLLTHVSRRLVDRSAPRAVIGDPPFIEAERTTINSRLTVSR